MTDTASRLLALANEVRQLADKIEHETREAIGSKDWPVTRECCQHQAYVPTGMPGCADEPPGRDA